MARQLTGGCGARAVDFLQDDDRGALWSTMTKTNHNPLLLRLAGVATGLAVALAPAVGTASAERTHSQQLRSDAPTSTEHTCRGEVATHVNEDGTGSDDVIVVTEQSITVNGWAGDDLICVMVPSNSYGAYVHGSLGNDTIITYSGVNHVYGGEDDDSILSNSADALLDGEEGNDNIYLGALPDLAYGGDGNDRIFGSPLADVIHAGGDDDLVIGFGGNDLLHGGPGNDRLEGRDGTDELDGQSGDDECVDAAAPATTFVGCESIVGLGVLTGPGAFSMSIG